MGSKIEPREQRKSIYSIPRAFLSTAILIYDKNICCLSLDSSCLPRVFSNCNFIPVRPRDRRLLLMQHILGLVRRCVEDYHMIDAGDTVAVGVSGGKDSLLTLTALARLR